MTDSIMRCCRRLAELAVACVMASCLMLASVVQAAEIDLRGIQLSPADDGGFVLATDLAFDFSPRLEEAVGKGVSLHFVAEFELTRPRWYWFDEKVVHARQTWRLTYHALTRQYRLSSGALHQSFSSLEDALRALSRIRQWHVIEHDRVLPGETFDAGLRVRLDTTQLPKPLQVEALSSKDWGLTSDWKRWSFTVPRTPPPATTSGDESK